MTEPTFDPTLTTPLEQMQDRLDFARKLQALTNRIHGTDNVDQIMLDLSAEISELFLCERLTLYVFDPERKALVSRVKSGINSNKDLVLPVDHRSIAGYVAATRTTVRIDNLDDADELKRIDPQLQFFNRVDGVTGFKSRQMLAAPLLHGSDRKLVGVLQLINQRADGRFDKVAEEGLEALTATLALALSKRLQPSPPPPAGAEGVARQARQAQDRLDFAKRLQALTDKIHATDNAAQIMVGLSAEISELFDCERVTLYVHDKERRALVSRVKSGIDSSKDLVLPLDRRSIGGYVGVTQQALRIDDLDDAEELKRIDPNLRFFSQVDNATGFKSRQMLAAPLLHGPRKELVGVLQLINQRTGEGFDKVAEEALGSLTATLALALSKRMKASAMLPERYDALIDQGIIEPAELELAQRWAQRKAKDIETVLVEDFNIPLGKIGAALGKKANLRYQPLEGIWTPNPDLKGKISKQVAEEQEWFPFARDGNIIVLVTIDPANTANRANMNRIFPYNELSIRVTTRTEFLQMVKKAWPG